MNQQQYLIKEIYEYTFQNVTGTNRVSLDSLGLIANWMWYFQRSDVNLRNQWSNYTNWPYDYLPFNVVPPPDQYTDPTGELAFMFECPGQQGQP